MTPLILDQTLWKTKKLRAEVATMADELRRAREIIELDLPLANELPFSPGEKWAGTLPTASRGRIGYPQPGCSSPTQVSP